MNNMTKDGEGVIARHWKTWRLLNAQRVVALIIVLFLTACGGGVVRPPDDNISNQSPSGDLSPSGETGGETQNPLPDSAVSAPNLENPYSQLILVTEETDRENPNITWQKYAFSNNQDVWIKTAIMPDGTRKIGYVNETYAVLYPDGRTETTDLNGVVTTINPVPLTSKTQGEAVSVITVAFPDGTVMNQNENGTLKTMYPDGTSSTRQLPPPVSLTDGKSVPTLVRVPYLDSVRRFAIFSYPASDGDVSVRSTTERTDNQDEQESTNTITWEPSQIFQVSEDGAFQYRKTVTLNNGIESTTYIIDIGFVDGLWIALRDNGHTTTTFPDGSQLRLMGKIFNTFAWNGTAVQGNSIDGRDDIPSWYQTDVSMKTSATDSNAVLKATYKTTDSKIAGGETGQYPDGVSSSRTGVATLITYPDKRSVAVIGKKVYAVDERGEITGNQVATVEPQPDSPAPIPESTDTVTEPIPDNVPFDPIPESEPATQQTGKTIMNPRFRTTKWLLLS